MLKLKAPALPARPGGFEQRQRSFCRETLVPHMRLHQGRFSFARAAHDSAGKAFAGPGGSPHQPIHWRSMDEASAGASTLAAAARLPGAAATAPAARWACCRPSDCARRSRANGSSPIRGGSPRARYSPRAWICDSGSMRGRCGAASCPTATRPSRRRSRIWHSNGSTFVTAPRSSATVRIWFR